MKHIWTLCSPESPELFQCVVCLLHMICGVLSCTSVYMTTHTVPSHHMYVCWKDYLDVIDTSTLGPKTGIKYVFVQVCDQDQAVLLIVIVYVLVRYI